MRRNQPIKLNVTRLRWPAYGRSQKEIWRLKSLAGWTRGAPSSELVTVQQSTCEGSQGALKLASEYASCSSGYVMFLVYFALFVYFVSFVTFVFFVLKDPAQRTQASASLLLYTRPAPAAATNWPIAQSDCVSPPPRRIEYGRMNTLVAVTGNDATFS